MKRIALLALASGLAIAAAAPAGATTYFAYSIDGGATKVALGSDASGNAGYTGSGGGYTFNLSALTYPVLTQPDMLTNSINVSQGVNRAGGNLIVYITQDNLATFGGPLLSTFTANNLTGSAQTVTMSTLYSTSNALYTGTLIRSATLTSIGTAGGINSISATGPFSTTVVYNMTFGAGVGSFNDTVNLQAVPEPATWGMMILGFGLMGGALRSRKTKVAFA